MTHVSPMSVSPRLLKELLEKSYFLSTKAAELEQCWAGATGTILATPEERLTGKDAHTETEDPRQDMGQISDSILNTWI